MKFRAISTTYCWEKVERETIETTSVALVGQIKGVEISIQVLAKSGLTAITGDRGKVLAAMEEQRLILQKCLTFCVGASSQAAELSGNHIKFAKVQDEAKQLVKNIGNVEKGGPAVVIDGLIAQDRAKAMGGSISGDVALAFLK